MVSVALMVSLLCPLGHGPFGRSEPTPDGRFEICNVDSNVPNKYELFGAGGVLPWWRLSGDMENNRDVIRFAISPDSQRVAFTSDVAVWTKYDLYTVHVAGGAISKINSPLPVEHDVDTFAWAGSRIVYVQGRNTTGFWELYSADRTGAGRTKLAPWGTVGRFFSILDGERVRFSADATGLGALKWFVVPASGGRVLEELFVDGFESGGVTRWQ